MNYSHFLVCSLAFIYYLPCAASTIEPTPPPTTDLNRQLASDTSNTKIEKNAQLTDLSTLETVVVRSTRHHQPLDYTSLSIGVVDNETIRFQDADHPAELLDLIPGVNINRGSGAEHLSAIRSPVLTGGAGAGSFLYMQNGIALRSAGFANTNGLLDTQTELAEQVEVIRGPSGPIYGANAVHGVVNVLSPAAPKQDENNMHSLQLSADSQARYKGKGTSQWSQNGLSGIAGISVNHENGYREHAGLQQQKAFFRITQSECTTNKIDTILTINNLNQETAGYIFGEEALMDSTLRRKNAYPFAYRDAQSIHLHSVFRQQTKAGNVFSITPYGRWHKMEFLQHFLPSKAVEKNGHWSIGSQIDSQHRIKQWTLLAGLDIEHTQGYLSENQVEPTVFSFTQGLHYDYKVNSSSGSAYLQAEYAINRYVNASIGTRIDHRRYDYNNLTSDGVVGRFLRTADRVDNYTTASPKISFSYQAEPQLMAYISLARANRPPQTSDLYRLQKNQSENPAQNEQMDALELGGRFSINSVLSAHIATYAMNKKNYFFRDANGYNVNNGKTRHQGIELDLNLSLSSQLVLLSGLSYARHTYQFDHSVAKDYETISKGNDMDSAPRILANTRLQWQLNEQANIELQWQRVGKYYTDAANLHSYNGHDVFHLRADYQLTPSTRIALAIRNLSDKLYAERADYAFGKQRYFPAETRNFSLNMDTTF